MMRFTIEGEHKKFFQTNRFIEFADLFTSQESQECSRNCDLAIDKQIHLESSDLMGRDLFRSSPDITKRCRGFAELLFALTDIKPIRLAYDQLLCVKRGFLPSKEGKSLEEISSLQGDLFGLILALQVDEPLPPPFPRKEGNGVFFKRDLPLCFDPLYKATSGCYLLIVYSGESTIVVEKKSDPLFFAFKRLGYGVGDRLRGETHPIVYR